MKIWSVSKIGSDGIQQITVEDIPAEVNARDLYSGGHYFSFDIDHRKQQTKVLDYSYRNGVPVGFDKVLLVLKDEVVTESEVIKIAEKIKENK